MMIIAIIGILVFAIGLVLAWASRDDWVYHVGIGLFILGFLAILLVGSVKFLTKMGEITRDLPPKVATK